MAKPLIVTLWFMLQTLPLFGSGQSEERHKVLVIGPGSEAFQEVVSALEDELVDDFHIVFRALSRDSGYESFARTVTEEAPKVLILMDNITIYYYREYQLNNPDKEFPPTIVSMALFIENTAKGLKNTTGVLYEIPALITITGIRDIIKRPVNRVGLIYRSSYQEFFDKQVASCSDEQIELVGYRLEDNEENFSRAIRKGLNQLTLRENVDGILILNDNRLLTSELINQVWVPRLRKFQKAIMVNVEPLIENAPLGNYSVIHDHAGMGKQISELVYQIMENDWQIETGRYSTPTSVKHGVRVDFARKYLRLRTEKLNQIDKKY